MSAQRSQGAPAVGLWRHVRAIALLPMMNTIVIPSAIVAATRPAHTLGGPEGSTLEAALLIAGAVSIGFGIALVAKAIAEFIVAGQGTLAPWDPARRMLTGGVYRITRNPLKLGLFAILLGEAAVLRSLPLLAWFALFAVVNVIYIRVSEEPGLRRRFGAEYDIYCECVPRWLPTFLSERRRRLQGDKA